MPRRAAAFLVVMMLPVRALPLDLSGAVVVTHLTGPERKAVTMLVDEVEKRTGIRWPVAPSASGQRIEVTVARAGPAEGYHIEVAADSVRVTGNDARGVLFGIGRLLREMRMERGAVSITDGWTETTAPKYPLRGHQLGYRPKTNSYDGWTVPVWEQYIRDLAVFGANAIELIPPRSDDARRQPALPAAADAHDDRDVAPGRRVRAGRLDLVSGDGQGLLRSEDGRVRALEEWGEVFRQAAAHRRRLRAGRRSRPHRAEST